ncbi:PQQ-dependent sugar dehydrogenase [Marinomonas algicola]|uniref:PQQ-dependent sugar dehydrogenase n=1 Tax=Marinomonas algicola TaxID=2773454 RepID=UPI00174BCC12|nr:PQQ-dependent sugar dehydrogenase [Marinomonas algicola]
MKKETACFTILMSFSIQGISQTIDDSVKVDPVAQFDGALWGLSLLDDQSAIVTLKKGDAYKVNLLNGNKHAVKGVPSVDSRGQGGLLDVAKSPNFNEEQWLYFTYAKPTNSGSATTLARAQLDGSQLRNWQDLLVTDSASSTTKHYGSRIAFDGDDHVFFSVGERGKRENAQDGANHAGSILRLNLDGSVPADNPFVSTDLIKNEIWSYGHRNPQGLFFDRETQTLWSNEHGPRGGDEINQIKAGANYGWPVVSHGKEYWGPISVGEGQDKPGMESPIKVYIPSIAPGSLLRYRSEPGHHWNGDFVSTALALRHLNRVHLDGKGDTSETRYLEELNERLRSIAQDSNGTLYIGTDSGKLLKVSLTSR